MITRTAAASSSQSLSGPISTSNHQAGPTLRSELTLGRNKRSAQALVAGKEDEELNIKEQGLSLGEVGDGEEDSDEDVSEDDEPFPELDSGSETGEDGERLHNNDDSVSEDEGLDDEDSGSASGYNSSDIERRFESSPSTSIPTSPSTSTNDLLTTDEKLSRMISKSTMKPDEAVGTDARLSHAKQGHGRLKKSRLVEGGFKREYEDVEAGYGSESSTEDVSQVSSHPTTRTMGMRDMKLIASRRILTLLVIYPWSGMTTSLTSVTTSTAAKYSDLPEVMSWTNS